MNLLIYEFMHLCQGSESFVNVSIYKWTYANDKMIATELFDGIYIEMPTELRYERIKKWDIEMRNYKPYIVLYI